MSLLLGWEGSYCNSHTGLTCFTGSFCLRCYQCYSNLSWEDCNKHAIETGECESPNVCLMIHQMFKRKEQQQHNFIKACYNPVWCLPDKCRQTEQSRVDGSWCEAKCCIEEDFCNDGMTPSWERAYGKEATSVTAPCNISCLIVGLLALCTVLFYTWLS